MASALAQVYHQIATDLFNAAFVSCWTELYSKYQDSLVKSLEKAFSSEKSPNVPPEISQMLLNLCEFMEHDEKPLPIEIRKLGDISEKCQAYAKALHYKELEFQSSPAACTQSLIHINNQLQQPEAAKGVLIFARQHHSVKQQESCFMAQQSRYKCSAKDDAPKLMPLTFNVCARVGSGFGFGFY